MESVLFGLLPESIYFTLFLVFAKGIKTKRILLFSLIFAANILFSAFLSYSVWYHVCLLATIYLIIKILYKAQIIDVFLISLSFIILTILGVVCYFLISNYTVALIINRALMFAVVVGLKNKIKNIYLLYRSVWNRNDNAKVKSITVRNISVILLNILLVAIVIGMAFFTTKSGGVNNMIWSFFGFCDTKDGE